MWFLTAGMGARLTASSIYRLWSANTFWCIYIPVQSKPLSQLAKAWFVHVVARLWEITVDIDRSLLQYDACKWYDALCPLNRICLLTHHAIAVSILCRWVWNHCTYRNTFINMWVQEGLYFDFTKKTVTYRIYPNTNMKGNSESYQYYTRFIKALHTIRNA